MAISARVARGAARNFTLMRTSSPELSQSDEVALWAYVERNRGPFLSALLPGLFCDRAFNVESDRLSSWLIKSGRRSERIFFDDGLTKWWTESGLAGTSIRSLLEFLCRGLPIHPLALFGFIGMASVQEFGARTSRQVSRELPR